MNEKKTTKKKTKKRVLSTTVAVAVAGEEEDQEVECKHRVAVIRQEGSNGDREMLAAFHAAGFEAWDVNMYDLLYGRITLESFRGIVHKSFVESYCKHSVVDFPR